MRSCTCTRPVEKMAWPTATRKGTDFNFPWIIHCVWTQKLLSSQGSQQRETFPDSFENRMWACWLRFGDKEDKNENYVAEELQRPEGLEKAG